MTPLNAGSGPLVESPKSNLDIRLRDRETPEIVIALVGPVGSGVTTTNDVLKSLLTDQFKYDVVEVKVSDIIADSERATGAQNEPRYQRILNLQGVGTALRQKFGEQYLADKCVEKIAIDRYDNDGYEPHAEGAAPIAKSRRRAHIIDSLKNPAELHRLREVYGDTFWVFGVFAPETIRRKRLEELQMPAIEIQKIFMKDEAEGVDYGQRVRDTIQYADFFIRNDKQNEELLQKSARRFLDLIFGIGIHTPTQHENAMAQAMAASSNSACMSRQVGAVIYSNAGELIGIGSNDVPKFGGGLYVELDGDDDNRCFKWRGKICHNDDEKSKLYSDVFSAMKKDGLLDPAADVTKIIASLKHTRVKDLIEFSRAVHAEMEAIISVARGNKTGIIGGTLYCTTFPCHSCARHIVASGVTKVFYIEPYAKSLADKLHDDSLSLTEEAPLKRVAFLQFEGVGPRNMLRLFKMGTRKEDGKLKVVRRDDAVPVFPSPLDGIAAREQLVVKELDDREERTKRLRN